MTLVFLWRFRLRVVPLSLSPSSVTQQKSKKTVRKKCLEASMNKPREKNGAVDGLTELEVLLVI